MHCALVAWEQKSYFSPKVDCLEPTQRRMEGYKKVITILLLGGVFEILSGVKKGGKNTCTKYYALIYAYIYRVKQNYLSGSYPP